MRGSFRVSSASASRATRNQRPFAAGQTRSDPSRAKGVIRISTAVLKGETVGSLKTYYFAHLHGLDEASTLRLFCEHCKDVLDTPDGDSHANIRAFLVSRHHKPVA